MTLTPAARIGLAAAALTGAGAAVIAHVVRKELRREAAWDLAETDLEAEREAWRLMPSDPPPSDPPPMIFKPRETRVSHVRGTGWDPCGSGPAEVTISSEESAA